MPEWSKEVPYQIKSIAIKDACTAVSNAKKKFKKTGKVNTVKYRSRKRGDYSVYIPKSAVTEKGIYYTLLGNLNIRESIGEVKYDCRFVLENDRYFLIVPVETQIKRPENQRLSVCALDPGTRTFQTVFCPEITLKIGEHDFAKIYRLCYKMDKLLSLRKTKATNRYTKKIKKLRWCIKDLINEVHHKTALFLVKSFDTVLIPTFETSQMVPTLYSSVARAMLTWAHYRFKQFLKFKGKEYSCNIIEVNEAYTSKTCGVCGAINDIGSKEHWKCSNCGQKHDRDINGARNIFIKNISLAQLGSTI